MKNKKHIYIQFLKIVSLISLLFFNASIMYSQNEMEDAVVSLSFSEENDIKTIIATVIDQTGLPIEGLELYFYVQRTFSLLPIGEGFNETDESGVVEIEFPNDLPGDAEGNVTIVVKITESDLYNDLALETIKNWGIPVLVDKAGEKRSLWATAANAPVSLITSVSLMIIAIWYIIFYIVFKLYKISKIKPLKS
ncbi:MAG: Ig-like domain-containing protein [Lutibacter sp.]|nr:MAG: hypothetical protein APF83_05355 [Lutibacter sp. BRH_c52]HCE54524.1 hypothetical protein [Lutibacter sp.]